MKFLAIQDNVAELRIRVLLLMIEYCRSEVEKRQVDIASLSRRHFLNI